MIDLYTAGTGNGKRASVMLEECGLAYAVHKIELGKPKPPDFLKINPAGTIPVIVDPDGPGGQPLVLGQSGAIALYLAEKTGKFLPKDPVQRAVVYQWFLHAMSDTAPTGGVLFQLMNEVADKPASAITHFETRLANFFRGADRRLAEAEYLAGELSIADFALYTAVAPRQALIDKFGGLENLKRWMATLAARPGVSRGMKVPQ